MHDQEQRYPVIQAMQYGTTSGCALQLMARQHTIYWGVVPCDVQLSVKPIRQAGD